MDGENRAYIQQAIGDTSAILATHFKTDLEHYLSRFTEMGMRQLLPIANNYSQGAPKLKIWTTDTDAEVLDVSLWRHTRSMPTRAVVAVNTKFSGFSNGLIQLIDQFEGVEKTFIEPGFQGHTSVTLSSFHFGPIPFALIVAPLSQGSLDYVMVTHIRLDRFQKAFSGAAMVVPLLIDEYGNILAHPDSKWIGKQLALNDTPLLQSIFSSHLLSGQMTYHDKKNEVYFGGYTRVGLGQLTVVASLSNLEATTALRLMKKQSILFTCLCFVFFISIGYFISTFSRFHFLKKLNFYQAIRQENSLDGELPKRISITVFYGSLVNMSEMCTSGDPVDVAEAMNLFFSVVASTVKEYGGIFRRDSNLSFMAFWGAAQIDGTEVGRAVRCALDLRKNLFHLNESRKLDGLKSLLYGMGIHAGPGILARLGAPSQEDYTVLGEGFVGAKALSQLTVASQSDLFISKEVWEQTDGQFQGEWKGEVKLTKNIGLTGYYTISSYKNERGEWVTFQTPENFLAVDSGELTLSHVIAKENKISRWLVNNGSQIEGPFNAQEIASRLFAQEFDFDCECWEEGIGSSAQIKTAGIFSGSQDDLADLWLFDGEMVHGPMKLAFLQAAVNHGAVESSVYICSKSTINGWKKLSEFEEMSRIPKSMGQQAPGSQEDPQKKAA